MTTADARNRLDLLQLPIEISPEDQQEIARLEKYLKKHSHVALDTDDSDPDPNAEAARQYMLSVEYGKLAQQKTDRLNAIAERNYAKRKKEMNSFGFRPTS